MWCGSCYTSNANIKFPVKKKALDEYKDLEDPNERERLQVAWGKKHGAKSTSQKTSFISEGTETIAWSRLNVISAYSGNYRTDHWT
jgi:hypothetical protein